MASSPVSHVVQPSFIIQDDDPGFERWQLLSNNPRRSTPRHPVAAASTPEPPDPMPCALAAVLLPGSVRTAAICRKQCFLDRTVHDHNCVRARAVPACWVRSCGVGKRLESGQLHGCRGAVHGTVHGRRLGLCNYGGLIDTLFTDVEGVA